MKKWQIALVAVVVVGVAVGGFFGGRASASGGIPTVQEALQVLPSQNGGDGFGFPGASGTNSTRRVSGAVSGSIIAADASSITVKTSDGNSKIVLLSSSTTISKVSEGTATDLVAGEDVVVTGTTNSDGTVTATRVQLGTTLPAGGFGGPPGDAGGQTPGGSASDAAGLGGPSPAGAATDGMTSDATAPTQGLGT